MNAKILKYIEYLEGVKSNIKPLHWDASNMSEHKLCDEIHSTVSEIQDEIAEEMQGIYGKRIGVGMFSAKKTSYASLEQLLKDLLKKTTSLRTYLESKDRFIGIKSILESFTHDINKYSYLCKVALKEDMKQRLMKAINEGKKKPLNEGMTNEKVKKVVSFLNKNFGKGKMPKESNGGLPQYREVGFLKDMNGNLVEPKSAREIFYMTQAVFPSLFGDDTYNDEMLKQIIKDWYVNSDKLKYGLTSKLINSTI